MKFEEAIDKFVLQGRGKYSGNTLPIYIDHLKRFSKFIGNKDIREIKLFEDILTYRQHLERRGLADNTINLAMIALRQLFKFFAMIEREVGFQLPFLWGVIPVRNRIIPRSHRPVEPKEFFKMLATVQGAVSFRLARDTTVLRMLYDTGVRVSELCELNISSPNFIDHSAEIVTKKRRDKSKKRRIFWTRETEKSLLTYIDIRQHYSGTDALFINRLGKRLTRRSVERIVKQFATRAGLDSTMFKPHCFRHGFGMRGAEAGVYPPALADLMGHTTMEGTKPYYNLKDPALKRAYAKLAKIGCPKQRNFLIHS